MRQSIALLSVLAGASFAVDTIDFFFPGAGPEGVDDPVATIKKADPTTTILQIACPTGVDSVECGWGTGLDLTVISKSHYQAEMSFERFSMSFDCDHNSVKSFMGCTVTMSADGELFGTEIATLSGREISFNRATIVEGASLLSAAASPAASATTAAATATNTGLQTSVTSPASDSGFTSGAAQTLQTASGSAAPAQQTGAAARFGIQGSALLVLAGVAAVNVL